MLLFIIKNQLVRGLKVFINIKNYFECLRFVLCDNILFYFFQIGVLKKSKIAYCLLRDLKPYSSDEECLLLREYQILKGQLLGARSFRRIIFETFCFPLARFSGRLNSPAF
jgi:hypothetical protein